MKIKVEEREIIIKNRENKYHREIYDKICENTLGMNLNEIHIKYIIKKNDSELKIFGDDFVINNYNNCKFLLNGKKYNLVAYLYIKKRYINKNVVEIKLRGIKNIISAKAMFFNCSSLKSLPDISNWNIDNVTNMIELFR